MQCGKEIYGLVLKQIEREGLGKAKNGRARAEDARREPADRATHELLTLVLRKTQNQNHKDTEPKTLNATLQFLTDL